MGLMKPRGKNYVTWLECSATGERYPFAEIRQVSDAGKPLLVRYDLERVAREVPRQMVSERPADMWRYRELLPLEDFEGRSTLGESMTPLVPLAKLAPEPGRVWIKDDSRLPTGSFKARGLAVAVSRARELGVSKLAMSSNGNAGVALAAYAARVGLEAIVFCPQDTPTVFLEEMRAYGAQVRLIPGLIHECTREVVAGQMRGAWYDVCTLREPYRIEGKKTIGLEIAEQCQWHLPDVIFYPTGGGTGLIGMWKAFQELRHIGWVSCPLPRLVAVQAAGCAPLVHAYATGQEHADPWPRAQTIAWGIRVPQALGDFLILRAVRATAGFALAVSDEQILQAQKELATVEGLWICPEGAATWAAYRLALERRLISASDRVVLFNGACATKYLPTSSTAAIASVSTGTD